MTCLLYTRHHVRGKKIKTLCRTCTTTMKQCRLIRKQLISESEQKHIAASFHLK